MNGYLVVAYGFVWALFTIYAWVIHTRQQTLEREVAELKKTLGSR